MMKQTSLGEGSGLKGRGTIDKGVVGEAWTKRRIQDDRTYRYRYRSIALHSHLVRNLWAQLTEVTSWRHTDSGPVHIID